MLVVVGCFLTHVVWLTGLLPVVRAAEDGGEITKLKAEIEQLKGLPSQSHAMMDVDYHLANLWFAAHTKNWPLAESRAAVATPRCGLRRSTPRCDHGYGAGAEASFPAWRSSDVLSTAALLGMPWRAASPMAGTRQPVSKPFNAGSRSRTSRELQRRWLSARRKARRSSGPSRAARWIRLMSRRSYAWATTLRKPAARSSRAARAGSRWPAAASRRKASAYVLGVPSLRCRQTDTARSITICTACQR